MHFREEPVTPVYRHWMCEQVGCNGELLSTGESITRLERIPVMFEHSRHGERIFCILAG